MDEVYRQVAQELSGSSLTRHGQLRLKVTSNSMSPILKLGDHVLVHSVSPDVLIRGDILVTQRPGGYLTHRFIFMDGHGWVTKGDRNRKADAPIPLEALVGLVVSRERNGHSRNLHTRFQRYLARISGWLGWKEVTSKSSPIPWMAKYISRFISVLPWIWEL